jgi:hypothetical protein
MKRAPAESFWLLYLAFCAPTMIFCIAPALAGEPLIYRRVLVPAAGLDGQIRGLLPMKREEFEHRLAIGSRAGAPIAEANVHVDQTIFRARLDDGQLSGSASLQVTHVSKEPALLEIEPCSVMIESMVWLHKEPRAAVFGADEKARLLCLVDKSGELALSWRQAPNSTAERRLVFELGFPAAPRRLLEINTPAEVEIQVDSGMIVASEPSLEDPNRRNWIIALTGRPTLRLEILRRVEKFRALAAAVVRDSALYHVLPATIDFETTLSLDVLQGSIHDINLSSNEPAALLAVQVDGQVAKCLAESDGDGASKRYTIDLPAPLAGINHTITVTGTSAYDQSTSLRLPRFLPVGFSVEEGAAEVTVPSWLQLHAKRSTDCVQTAANSTSAGRSIDRFAFQLVSPSAAVEVTSNRSAQPLTEDSGTQIHFETNQVTGIFIADLASRAPNVFTIDAQISKQWIVDAVETQPPDALTDRVTTSGAGGVQRLRLQLARPISIARPLRVTVRAHARRPAMNELLDGNYFRFAQFPDARGSRQLLSVDVWDPHVRFEQRGKSPHSVVNDDELSAQDHSLFEGPASPIYQLSPEIKGTLVAAKAQYRADVLVRAERAQHSLIQRASIRCQPEGSSVPSILVGLSPPPSGDVNWRLGGERLIELPVTLEGPPAAHPDGAAYFRILLPKAQLAPFEIYGEWNLPMVSDTAITLLTLPEAAHQQGLLEVHAPGNRFSIKTDELKPLPIASSHSTSQPSLLGRYQYDAGRQAKAMLRAVASGQERPHAWVEKMRLISQFSTDGRGEHEMECIVHPSGDEVLHVQAPANAMHCRLVRENGGDQLLEATGSEFRFRVPLDPAESRTTVRIRYLSEAEPSGHWPITKLTAPILKFDALILTKGWQVLIPPQYAPIIASVQESRSNAEAHPAPDANPRQGNLWSWTAILAGPDLINRVVGQPEFGRSDERGSLGWRTVQFELPSDSGSELWVYRNNVIQSWAWCFAFLGGVLGWCLCRVWKFIVVFLAVLLTIALMFTQPWSSLAEGLAVGMAIAGILSILCKRPADSFREPAPETGTARFRIPAGTPVAVIAFLILASVLSPRIAAQQVADRMPKVIIPVDSNQQQTGDYVYLDEVLYDALHEAADAGREGGSKWLLESAHYEVPTAPEMGGDKSPVKEVRMSFDFYTFYGSVVMPLPMRREQVFLLEGRARLDSQPAKLTWRPDGGELALHVMEAGKHRLELALGATAKRTDDGLRLDLNVPPAVRTTIGLPSGAKLLSATGIIPTNGSHEALCLPSSKEISVLWPETRSDSTAEAGFEAEQLSLWRVRWGAVVLESLIRVKPNGKPLREFLIECDPRLRVLPPSAAGPIGRISVHEGSPNFIKVELAEPLTSDTSMRLTWLWPDASGIGQWELPPVRVHADRMVREWTAVWHEPGLSLVCSAPLGSPQAAEFGAAFGETDTRHIAAVFDTAQRQPQFVECKPEPALPRSEQALELGLSPAVAEIRFTAHLTNIPRYYFEHQLAVPTDVRVKQVTIIQRGRAASVRWERSANGQVALYLLESPEPEQTLELVAEIPLQQQPSSLQPPQIEVLNVERSAAKLTVFRQSELQVSFSEAEGWTAVDETIGRFEPGRGRLVAAFRNDSPAKHPPVFSLTQNRPQLDGQALIHVQHKDNEWTWEADLDLNIADGLLDDLVLSLPAELSTNIEVFPEMDFEFEMGRAQQRRLILRPRVPAVGSLRVRLGGPLIGGTEGIAAPQIVLEELPDVRPFVLLDRGAGENQYDWETTGLKAMDESSRQSLPAPWRAHRGDWYQASVANFLASAHARRPANGTFEIPFIDVRGKLLAGRLKMTAEAIVLPPSDGKLRFSLPPECRLLQTLVEDITVQPATCGLRSWELPPTSDVLPYHLTIIYDTFLPRGQEMALHFVPPQIAAAHVNQTLLSLSGSRNAFTLAERHLLPSESVKTNGVSTCGPAKAESVRIQALARAIEEITAGHDGTLPPAITSEVFARFEGKFQAGYRALQKAAEADDGAPLLGEQAASSADAVRKARLRLEHAGLSLPEVANDVPVPDEMLDRDEPIFRCLIAGNLTEITVRLHRQSSDNSAASWSLVILLLTFAGALFFIPTQWITQHWLVGMLPVQLGLCAIIWWLLAPAGWLGLLLLAVAVIAALRSRRRREIRERGSSLLRTA